MKKLISLFILAVTMIACNQPDDTLEQQLLAEEELVSSEAVQKELPELSIYNLPSSWTNQDNVKLELQDLRGKVVVMVMIYTSCKAACPRLVADMRNIEKQIDEKYLRNVQFVMVSIDPETDTPQRLETFAKENMMEDDHWMFLTGTPEDTREFAAVLAVSYKKISPIDFSHSNIISVFDENGLLVHQQEGLGVDNKETVQAIKDEVTN